MPAPALRATQHSRARVLVQLQGERGTWSAWLVPTPHGWRAWLTQGGLSALSEEEALAWAEDCADALELSADHPPP
jgi:hypothetical protein